MSDISFGSFENILKDKIELNRTFEKIKNKIVTPHDAPEFYLVLTSSIRNNN